MAGDRKGRARASRLSESRMLSALLSARNFSKQEERSSRRRRDDARASRKPASRGIARLFCSSDPRAFEPCASDETL